jgi:hypothetical protein
VFPAGQQALALVQVLWGAGFSLGHPDQRLLRLSVVPFVLLAMWCSYRLAYRLGAGRFWSGVAAVTLLGTPLFMSNATSFMSDNVYVGIVLGVALAGISWIGEGKYRWPCVGLLALAPLQRQVGISLALAVTLGLVFCRRRELSRSDTVAIAATWILTCAVTLGPGLLGIGTPAISMLGPSAANIAHAVLPLPAMLGLGLIPFGVALALKPKEPGADSWWSVASGLLGVVGAVGCLVDLAQFGMIFTGNVFTPLGFAAILQGAKPPIFPGQIFRAVEIAAIVTFALLFILRRRWWKPVAMGNEGLFLVLVSDSQFLPLLAVQTFIYDRYFLPVIAPLIPVVAMTAARSLGQLPARTWAALALLGGVALYIAGEQDYLAWQAARDRAAQLAYQMAPGREVQAGFEANAVYVELPDYERTGRADLFAITGPADPQVSLLFAPLSDRRPGVPYSSLAPGRIVLELNPR